MTNKLREDWFDIPNEITQNNNYTIKDTIKDKLIETLIIEKHKQCNEIQLLKKIIYELNSEIEQYKKMFPHIIKL